MVAIMFVSAACSTG